MSGGIIDPTATATSSLVQAITLMRVESQYVEQLKAAQSRQD